MEIEGALPPGFMGPLARALARRGFENVRVVESRSGKQGTCFVLEGREGRGKAVLKTMSPLRPANTPESAEREYKALELFYQETKAHPNVGAPEPLEHFGGRLGYLMGHVDAPGLEDLLEADRLDDEELRTVAGRVVSALGLYYDSVGELYGDFQPRNVLVRPSSLRVFLLDPTPTNSFQQMLGEGAPYSPASADLGYWAYSVAARSVKQGLVGSKLPAKLYGLTSEMISRACETFDDGAPEGFRDAVFAVAGRYADRLGARRRLKDKVLGALARGRLDSLRMRSWRTATRGT